MPTRVAVLLLDLQVDFLDAAHGRMPVDQNGALRVVAAANCVLAGEVLAGALPVLIVNQFPTTAKLANFFRNGAGVVGCSGANLDPRIHAPSNVRIFPKEHANAFTNRDLEPYLREHGVGKLWVMGVFAEGCVTYS